MSRKLSITRDELDAVKRLPQRLRMDWPAVFSANHAQKIWLWRRWGNTPYKERVFVQGQSRIIDTIAGEYLSQRPDGGRFFIDDRGAYYSLEILGRKSEDLPIVAFEIA